MKQLIRRVKSRAGESLIESMVAILIFTFASIIMFSMISAAADINQKAKDTSAALQSELMIVEKAASGGMPGTVTVTVGSDSEQVDVTTYGAENKLQAYYIYNDTTE